MQRTRRLFTTNNPEIPLVVWVREVLKGNYRSYLEDTAVAYHQKRRLKNLAAPLLIQFREFYQKIIRDDTYRKKVDSCYRIFNADKTLRKEKALQKKFDEIYSEIDWLGKEYQSLYCGKLWFVCVEENPGEGCDKAFFPAGIGIEDQEVAGMRGDVQAMGSVIYSAFGRLEREFYADKR